MQETTIVTFQAPVELREELRALAVEHDRRLPSSAGRSWQKPTPGSTRPRRSAESWKTYTGTSPVEQQRDALAALGDGHVEIRQSSFDQRYRTEIEWEPIRSKLTGLELATEIESSIAPLRQEVRTPRPDRGVAGMTPRDPFRSPRGTKRRGSRRGSRSAYKSSSAGHKAQPATRLRSSERRTDCASCAG